MIQLLLHLWGDYCFQPGPWAEKKDKSIPVSELSDDDLTRLAALWTQALHERAKTQRIDHVSNEE